MNGFKKGLAALAVGWLLATAVPSVRADEPPKWHPWRLRLWPGRLYIGYSKWQHTFERAGMPCETSCLAHPSYSHRYYGYEVGGGSPCRGTGASWPAEGTWGWDYGGLCSLVKPKIALLWGGRKQGGVGKYEIDGPHVVDVGPYVERIKEGPCAIVEIKHNKQKQE